MEFETGTAWRIGTDDVATVRRGTFDTYGMSGCVVGVDERASICLQLYISAIYAPCFWYPSGQLNPSGLVGALPLSYKQIEERMLYARAQAGSLTFSPITVGLLQSWLISKLNIRPGLPVIDTVRAASCSELIAMYGDVSDGVLNWWAEKYDTRIKRVLISGGAADPGEVGSISRPKIV